MDFSFTEEQEAIGKVARQLFEDSAGTERLTELEHGEVRHDPDLWLALAGADVLGIALPDAVGGSGHGFLELAVVLTEVGRSVAPVPIYASLVLGADSIARLGTPEQQLRYLPGVADGSRILSAALTEPGSSDPTRPTTRASHDGDGWRLDGVKSLVPAGQLADAILVPAAIGDGESALFVVDRDAAGVDVHPVVTTNFEPHADVVLDAVKVDGDALLGDPTDGSTAIRALRDRALVGLCAMQLGVTEFALRLAASYTTEREQFGRPIGSFQAVQQRLADAFIDVEAIRWTTWNAAWLITEGRPAEREAAIAKFWAAEAGARVVASAQQVHGGIGIDTSYPLFRYFLWAKQIELALGAATQHLARLGRRYTEDEDE
jgi:alkylation response protein AidB-like acyl-CoA dehydrogenase